MENKDNKLNDEQLIVLSNRKNISISGTNRILSLKPELIQLDTNQGNIIIIGSELELIKLDNQTTRAEISGIINEFKFCEKKNKESLIRKIFK